MDDATEKPLTEADGKAALQDHILARASEIRARYGEVDVPTLEAILGDRDVVRYDTRLLFDAAPLEPGEFAWARPRGEHPSAGFDIVVHPSLEARPDLLPAAVLYHLVRVNYGEIATHEEAELFGATVLGLAVDDYYERVCSIADGIGAG